MIENYLTVNTTYEKVREILNVEMHYLQERVKNESFGKSFYELFFYIVFFHVRII